MEIAHAFVYVILFVLEATEIFLFCSNFGLLLKIRVFIFNAISDHIMAFATSSRSVLSSNVFWLSIRALSPFGTFEEMVSLITFG